MNSPDSMPSSETDDPPESTVESGLAELERHRYASALAQIEIASRFRNEKEPLFDILSPVIYALPNL